MLIYLLGWLVEGAQENAFTRELPQRRPDYRISTATKVMTLSLIFVGMITFNNLCLKYVEVSFYNVARSLSIVFNVAFTYVLLGEKTSFRTCACLVIVIFGFFVGSEGEVNFSLLGTSFGVMSSVFVCLNAIYTKKAMGHVDGDMWKLSYYNNVNASILFVPLMLITGEHNIRQSPCQHWSSHTRYLVRLFTCFSSCAPFSFFC
jgi:GDP-fucose transporter C1